MNALSVHGLGGGFAYGVRQAGWQLSGMAETSFAQATRLLNNPDVPEFDVKGEAGWKGNKYKPNLVFGCPPCAGFSVAGSGLVQHDNPEHPINDGIRDWFRWVEAIQPELAVLESVPRTFFSPAGQQLIWPLISQHLEGYGVNLVTYDNQQMGVPQKRVRTTLWAMRGGIPNVQLNWSPYRYTGTADAIEDLAEQAPFIGWEVGETGWGHVSRPVHTEPPHPDWIMRSVPWGGNARKEAENLDIWNTLQSFGRQRPSFLWRRLHPDRPSPVLLADACERVGHYHGPREGAGDHLRYLSGREVARLMGYPDTFRLIGHLRREVGPALCQAVSPKVGYWVGNEAGRLLEEADPFLPHGGEHEGLEAMIAYTDLSRLPIPAQHP